MSDPVVIEQVREHYAGFARKTLDRETDRVAQPQAAGGCCSSSSVDSACCTSGDTIPANALAALQGDALLPSEVIQTSLGCGTPLELARLQPGETVLDLGSGGGLDCFYAAKLVGPVGHVIGVDMTPEMLELANTNKEKVGLQNVEFRRGYLEELPVSDASVDVIISNCVINLSTDKERVFREAFRVLKPGGRVAFSDMVARFDIPPGLRKNMQAWSACVSGAITREQYREKMERAGFIDVAAIGEPAAVDIVYSAKFTAQKRRE
jgi:arsenite methyltransferase